MVASRIKGIAIEIGGDTTKLQTALKGIVEFKSGIEIRIDE
jgi:phage-related minor tail protein